MKNQILKFEEVGKSFSGVQVLKNINLSLQKGEVHALVGENGAGKSTLIKILTGAYTKDSGKVIFDGSEIINADPISTRHLGISAIYQELTLLRDMPVYQNLFLGSELTKGLTNDKQMKTDAANVLESLAESIDPLVKVSELTIANQQMVEIARALLFNTKILIMDEPTSSISQKETKKLFEKIQELKNQGVTIIYISHRMSEIFEICDRVTVMRDGELIITKDVSDVASEEELVSYMIGKKNKSIFTKVASHTDEVVLEIKDLSLKNVFKNINFTVKKGEIFGIGGLVGSKRSEIVETIFGLRKQTSGTIVLNGKKITNPSPISSINMGLALVTEDRKKTGLFLDLDVKENITMPYLDHLRNIFCINKAKEEALVNKFMNQLKVKATSSKQIIRFLSGGNQQKALIARWVCVNPLILIMDEPTRGIDVNAKAEIYSMMGELVKTGISIIMISSELPELITLSDRVLVMHEGKQVGILKGKNEITEENILKLAFGGSI